METDTKNNDLSDLEKSRVAIKIALAFLNSLLQQTEAEIEAEKATVNE